MQQIPKNLQYIIEPTGSAQFFSKYLEHEPLVIKRNNNAYFNQLLQLKDIEYLLSNIGTLGSYDIRLASTEKLIFDKQYAQVSRVQNMEIKGRVDPDKLSNLFQKHKATIIIDQITNIWPPLMELCNSVNQDLLSSSDCNVYISPDQSQGFEAHYDTHDVFILQVFGKKRWKVYPNPVALPLASQSSVAYDCSGIDALYDFELNQGDTIYIPRGYVHEAMTVDGTSAHVTLGVYNTTWPRLILDLITGLAVEDEVFRSGFFADDLRGNVDKKGKLNQIREKITTALTLERLNAISQKYQREKTKVISLASSPKEFA